tara:strand:- start:783 stop:953 length:171 start_codon:yes stop_codon:yes gene_type:complete
MGRLPLYHGKTQPRLIKKRGLMAFSNKKIENKTKKRQVEKKTLITFCCDSIFFSLW